jgi:hypothetical protein
MTEMEEIKNRNHVATRREDAEDAGHSMAEFVEVELGKPFMELRINKTRSGYSAVLIDTHNCDSTEVACCLTYGAMMAVIN